MATTFLDLPSPKSQPISQIKSSKFSTMILPLLFLITGSIVSADDNGFSFIFNDSQLVGVREIQPNGQVLHTNETQMSGVGHTFYSRPFRFKNSTSADAFSFSTSFVFGIIPQSTLYTFHGMTFAIAPSKAVINASSSEHLGLFNRTNDGNASNHVVALELDTFQNLELSDINSNHVGLDINSVVSVFATTAGYYDDDDNGAFKTLTLSSSQEIRAWVEYDGVHKQLTVTLAPLNLRKPKKPLFSLQKDLSPFLLEEMFVGFTSATGVLLQSFYVLAWSFQMNGEAQDLDVSKIPPLPLKKKPTEKKQMMILAIGLSLGGLSVISSALILGIVLYRRRKRKFAEVLEVWEVQYGPHRFSYKDLFKATKGFKESELLGKGGFGQVYKGTLPELGTQVAVKKVVCGRRPVELQGRQETVILVEWVLDCCFKEELLSAVDPKLKNELDVEEMGLVLKIGLLCSHSVPAVRPSMSQVLKFLKRMESLPEDFDGVLDIREDYSGRLGDASTSAYFSQIQYNTVSSPITNSITCSGR
ncbi:hypothetical protein L1987_04424 [Smallanthus sonchifolius]|uniref:Uncharacterized protein n=1 Tax=Smallanthus sonchifolius TaxID=185202 RepID=A0ACB9KDC4_9ASTR|nr:hypothetical protein L1987_04424 [Smallanthus sonchifolius]